MSTARTRIRRVPARASHDRALVDAVLDEALVAHVGIVEDGAPVVTPTLFARVGDELYLHGSSASRTLRVAQGPVDVCVSVTLVDGIVLARSAFHHSINYRSVALFGAVRAVEGAREKAVALEAFTERLLPGRWPQVRWPTAQELKATSVLALPIEEWSAKTRTGPPVDDEDDYAMEGVWAGVLPLALRAQPPQADPRLTGGHPGPEEQLDRLADRLAGRLGAGRAGHPPDRDPPAAG